MYLRRREFAPSCYVEWYSLLHECTSVSFSCTTLQFFIHAHTFFETDCTIHAFTFVETIIYATFGLDSSTRFNIQIDMSAQIERVGLSAAKLFSQLTNEYINTMITPSFHSIRRSSSAVYTAEDDLHIETFWNLMKSLLCFKLIILLSIILHTAMNLPTPCTSTIAILRNIFLCHRRSNKLQTCITVIGCLTLQGYQNNYTEAISISNLCCTWRTQSQCWTDPAQHSC